MAEKRTKFHKYLTWALWAVFLVVLFGWTFFLDKSSVKSALDFLLNYKYYALFLITFLAAIALPLPSAATLMAAAAFATRGYFSLGAVIAVAGLGNVLGDNVGYGLARVFGKPVLNQIGFRRVIESDTFRWLEHEAAQFKFLFVFLSRFNVLSTISVNLIAGLSRMAYLRFLLYDILGEGLQVAMYAYLGYYFAEGWENAYRISNRITLAIVAAALVLLFLAYRKVKKHVVERRNRFLKIKE